MSQRSFAYEIDDVLVSDFVTPAYYRGDDRRSTSGGASRNHSRCSTNGLPVLARPGRPNTGGSSTRSAARSATSASSKPSSRRQRRDDGGGGASARGRARDAQAPRNADAAAAPSRAAELDGLGALPGAVNDQVARVDQLGFRDYVIAFADLIESPLTEPPITIGIYGAWGPASRSCCATSKASCPSPGDAAPETPRVHVVRFNAWEYSSSAAIWPSLVRKIVVCVEKEVRWRFPGRFLRKLWRNLWWSCARNAAGSSGR